MIHKTMGRSVHLISENKNDTSILKELYDKILTHHLEPHIDDQPENTIACKLTISSSVVNVLCTDVLLIQKVKHPTQLILRDIK